MYITGPDVVKTVTHEDVTHEELGGASVHASKSGVCHLVADNEQQALLLARELMSYLPQNNMEDPPYVATTDDPLRADTALDSIIPDNPNRPYDMKEVIKKVVDDSNFFEIHENFAMNLRTKLLPGYLISVVALVALGGGARGSCAGWAARRG